MGVVEVLAILLSPLIALQVSTILQLRRDQKSRRIQIYRTLMATRSQNLSWDHINALNAIDLDFAGQNKKDKAVRDKWKEYLDHLNDSSVPFEQWAIVRIDKFVELLFVMGEAVGYSFDRVHLKRGTYSPRAHGLLEEDQHKIRTLARQLLEGGISLPVRVVPGGLSEDPIQSS